MVLPQTNITLVPKFTFDKSGLELERRMQFGSFFDAVGRRSAVYGYENQNMEAWVHPLKVIDDLRLAFRIEGYPLEIPGPAIATHINARPESTTFTYSHTAFTVRQTIFAPVDEPGIIMLLDVNTTLPLMMRVSFRPQLRLYWPAGLQIGNLEWDRDARVYYLTEDSRSFVGIIGSPLAQDISVQPYQEEPRDVPAEFLIEARPEQLRTHLIPIVIAAGIDTGPKPVPPPGVARPHAARQSAKQTYDRLLSSAEKLYQQNATYYRELQGETVSVETPDDRFNRAYAWAKVGLDKGFATNPTLGTGLLAGFRTSGNSERPGFAWFFGRDALWTALALTSYGDFTGTRTALDFLRKFQRKDGKIPHEISQSAALIPWFTDYEYPWASADATPLYVIVHADYWRASGDT
ncbi:MAG: amylo-alpha-1,6-glucosidase, partial [Pyrinomonadaceae bacterium]|nr:amylo-alpha-1,6-glucosidase [Pyrinomonadaceae bacterium]